MTTKSGPGASEIEFVGHPKVRWTVKPEDRELMRLGKLEFCAD